MEYTKFSGKTVNDAIIDACQKLEVTSDKLEYEVVEEGSSGFLGFNAKPAIINARVKEEEAKPDQKAKDFLNDVFASMKLTVVITADYNEDDNSLSIDLAGDDMGILIGKRGQTLDSLQYLVSLVVNKGHEEYIRVKVDTENYRQRRKETLENLAKNIAFKVKRTKRPVSLEPMNPYERRIIHTAVQKVRGATSWSEGENLQRHVVIGPDRKKQSYGNRNGRYNSGYGNRNSSQPRRRSGDYQRREYTDEQKKHPDDSVFSTFESEHLEEAPTTSLYGKIEINKD